VQPGRQQIDIRDRPTAQESTCVLAVSCLRLPAVDWSGLPLSQLLVSAVQGDGREYIGRGPTIQTRRGDLEFAWTEQRVVDAGERREARCRMCLVRGDGVQCLISFDFWPEDEARLHTVWETMLDSLRLNAPVEDPTRGKRIE